MHVCIGAFLQQTNSRCTRQASFAALRLLQIKYSNANASGKGGRHNHR
jgi:hypothetical protein